MSLVQKSSELEAQLFEPNHAYIATAAPKFMKNLTDGTACYMRMLIIPDVLSDPSWYETRFPEFKNLNIDSYKTIYDDILETNITAALSWNDYVCILAYYKSSDTKDPKEISKNITCYLEKKENLNIKDFRNVHLADDIDYKSLFEYFTR